MDNLRSGKYMIGETQIYYKHFGDDRELEVLQRILESDETITVPIIEIKDRGFVMELYDIIEEETSDIIKQKIILLYRLHKIGVYHNDLGNHNFLIKDGVVKIIDFGSAYLTDTEEWLEVLYENILANDGEIITSKEQAFKHEMDSFLESYKFTPI